ncbi:tyrosine-protein phosphatase [Nocardioides sp. Iso805N]|uniref:tyrosine-protein phosphatase n=1 Tax=Nocardioides sp. Iso805N TaxID=1283287 RepID=UPI000376067B|nr:tyrosine-protein phosphatase [Nocardioides sp. Iso805N]
MSSSPFITRSRAAVAAFATASALLAPMALSGPAHADTASPASTKAYAGVIPFTAADVTNISGSDWSVSWTAPADVTSVQVFVGTSATSFPTTPTTTVSTAAGAATITSATRPWVKLVASYGAPLVISTRSLGLASDANLRDAGGYRTTTGQWVKEGVVLRSQALAISSGDQAAFNTLGISTDYDLRTSCEAIQVPDVVPTGATRVHLNVMGDGAITDPNATTCAAASQIPAGMNTPAAAAAMMTQGEVAFVDSSTAKTAYQALYTGILGDQGVSLYHCTAGKDRTGWASAALLTLLGVPAADVMRDYLLSNTYYLAGAGQQTLAGIQASAHDAAIAHGATEDQAAAAGAAAAATYTPLMEVRAEYLQAGLTQVKTEYGSMENYFEKGLGLTRTQVDGLRAKLLTGAPIPAATTAPVHVTPGKIAVAKPTLKGKAKVGAKVTGTVKTPAGTTVSYQWLANGKAITGATKAKLKLTKALKGKRVALRVVVAESGYTSSTVTSKAVKVKA